MFVSEGPCVDPRRENAPPLPIPSRGLGYDSGLLPVAPSMDHYFHVSTYSESRSSYGRTSSGRCPRANTMVAYAHSNGSIDRLVTFPSARGTLW